MTLYVCVCRRLPRAALMLVSSLDEDDLHVGLATTLLVTPAFLIVSVHAASFPPAFPIVCLPAEIVFNIDTRAQRRKV